MYRIVINSLLLLVDCPSSSVKDVSILVTEPSPECPTGPSSKNRLHTDSASTLVHVLVHRESEEYQTDTEDGGSTDKGKCLLLLYSRKVLY